MKKPALSTFAFLFSVTTVVSAYAMGNRPEAKNDQSQESPSTVSTTGDRTYNAEANPAADNMGPAGIESSRAGSQSADNPHNTGYDAQRPDKNNP